MKLNVKEYIEKYKNNLNKSAFIDMDDSHFSYCDIKHKDLEFHDKLKEFRKLFTKCEICGDYFKGTKKTGVCNNTECIEKYTEINRIESEKKRQTCLKNYGYDHPSHRPDYKEHLERVHLERYGVTNYSKTDEAKNKVKQTKFKNHGSENFNNREKAKQTMLKKYNVENVSQSQEFKNKKSQTFLKNFGVDNIFKSKIFKESIKQKNLEKYGTEYFTQTEEFKLKLKQTKLERYGDENYNNTNKAKQTSLEKYGFINYSQTEECKKKILRTNLEKYGVKYFSQIHYKNINNLNEIFVRENFIKSGRFYSYDFMKYFGMSFSAMLNYKEKFNILEPNKKIKHKIQTLIYDSIKTSNKIENTQKIIEPLEIDIFLSDIRLAIEYNGLMYHSFGISTHSVFNNTIEDNKIHLRKTELCESKGIQLFHIFEGENIDAWFSWIHNKLRLNKLIETDKCNIREIDKSVSKKFINENHVLKYTDSEINLGLFTDTDLLAVMTFDKNDKEYKLNQYAYKNNYYIEKASKKLFNYFIKNYNPDKIISLGERRFTSGLFYYNLGFKLKNILDPDYFFFKRGTYNLLDRRYFENKSLEEIYEDGYRKIFNSGYLVFEYEV